MRKNFTLNGGVTHEDSSGWREDLNDKNADLAPGYSLSLQKTQKSCLDYRQGSSNQNYWRTSKFVIGG